ncbi:MAG: glycosyltransferase family 4 protein [Planctomycetes bacterium]|nr:glycosyltransferase family 4 protein [Planctomycetota bacterium]
MSPTPRSDSSPFEAVPQPPFWHEAPAPTAPNRRALLIVPWFTMGGADKFNLRLIQQLTSRGWEITLAATNRGDQSWLADFAAITPDVFVLPHFVRPNAAPLFLRHLIQTRRPQVVMVSNSELGYLMLPYLRHHCPDPAYVDYSHMEEPRWKNGGWSRYGAAWQDQLELNIVTSNHLRNWMISRGAEPDRVEVCTINEDPGLWQAPAGARDSLRKRLEIPQSSSVILYAARICEQKQPHVFAHTLQLLASRGVDFHAIIAGDGPDRHALEADLRARGVSNRAHFLLAVPAADMPAVYAASDLLFLPSDREGIALVMFEAMAAGLPVVGAAVGGQPELVTPDCGVLIPKSNPTTEAAAYADVIAALLASPAKRAAMGAAGRQRISEHFSLDVMGNRMVALFERALTLAKQQPRPAVSARTAQELATLAVEYLRVDQSAPPPALAVPLRYRLADSLNLALKRFGLSGPIKRAVLKVARNKH